MTSSLWESWRRDWCPGGYPSYSNARSFQNGAGAAAAAERDSYYYAGVAARGHLETRGGLRMEADPSSARAEMIRKFRKSEGKKNFLFKEKRKKKMK